MSKYRVKKQVAVVKGNKVTIYGPSDELINFDDSTAATFGDNVEKVGKDEPAEDQIPDEQQVPADTPDTQAATSRKK